MYRIDSTSRAAEQKQIEWQSIQQIAYANHIPLKWPHKLTDNKKQKTVKILALTKVYNRIIYRFNPQIRTMTNLVKHNMRIAFRTMNSISHTFKAENPKIVNVYVNSGIYDLIWVACHLNYLGQTGRSFKQRYSDHVRYIYDVITHYRRTLITYYYRHMVSDPCKIL
jgi:ribosomal protein L30/L7E